MDICNKSFTLAEDSPTNECASWGTVIITHLNDPYKRLTPNIYSRRLEPNENNEGYDCLFQNTSESSE